MSIFKELIDIPQLETERLILRKLRNEDAADIFKYAQQEIVAKFLPWAPHTSIEDSVQFIEFANEQFRKGISIVFGIELKSENKIIGTIDLRNWKEENRCGDIGYVINPEFWNRGIIKESLHTVLKFGFEELELHRCEAHCEEENIGSWKAMERCGMKYEGTLREKAFFKNKFRSMKMYSILRSEWK